MENQSLLHLPTSLVNEDPVVFWRVCSALHKNELHNTLDILLSSDWTSAVDIHDMPQEKAIVFDFLTQLFESDDERRFINICEAFEPTHHKFLFDFLRSLSLSARSKKCINWLVNQGIIDHEKSLEAFKRALWDGQVEVAKTLSMPTGPQAELIFFEHPELLNRNSASLLFFLAPQLASFKALEFAMDSNSQEELVQFLCWKMESQLSKSELKYPDGDEKALVRFIEKSLSGGYMTIVKRIIDWDLSLLFETFAPQLMMPPWDQDKRPLKLDGKLALSLSDWACLYNSDTLARFLKSHNMPPPDHNKLLALIPVLAARLEQRQPGQSALWAHKTSQRIVFHIKNIWL